MKKILFLFLLCASVGFSQTAKTRSALYTEVNTNFADNTGGAITPLILRNTVADMIASAFNPATDGSAAGLSANNTWTGTNGFQALTATTFTASGASSLAAVSISGALTGTGVTNYFSSPSAIGNVTPSTGAFTALSATGNSVLGGALYVGASGGPSFNFTVHGLTNKNFITYYNGSSLNMELASINDAGSTFQALGLLASNFYFSANGLNALTLDSSQNAVFSAKVTSTGLFTTSAGRIGAVRINTTSSTTLTGADDTLVCTTTAQTVTLEGTAVTGQKHSIVSSGVAVTLSNGAGAIVGNGTSGTSISIAASHAAVVQCTVGGTPGTWGVLSTN